MEQGLFFPSKNGDRKYKASDFTGYFSHLFSNGVFSNNSENLQVAASKANGLAVVVGAGYGNINGYLYQLTEAKTIVFKVADVSGTAKKGAVVLRMDLNERLMSVETKGTTELTRTNSIYELMLAEVAIPGGGLPITQSMIKDTRGNGELCGYVSSLIDIDPTTLWLQFEADWKKWLEDIKDLIDENEAAKLALAIDELKKNLNTHLSNESIHITNVERTNWNNKAAALHSHSISQITNLQTELNQKEAKVSDSGWIKAVTSGVTHNANQPFSYRKIGNRVEFRGGGNFPIASGYTFLIMPSGFYPSQEYRASATVQDSDTTKKFIFQVLTNGTCKIIHNTVSSNIVWMDGQHYYVD